MLLSKWIKYPLQTNTSCLKREESLLPQVSLSKTSQDKGLFICFSQAKRGKLERGVCMFPFYRDKEKQKREQSKFGERLVRALCANATPQTVKVIHGCFNGSVEGRCMDSSTDNLKEH